MNYRLIKSCLAQQGTTLASLARASDIPYSRLVKVTNGLVRPRSEEIDLLSQATGLSRQDVLAKPAGVQSLNPHLHQS